MPWSLAGARRRWRDETFGPASERPYTRRVSDAIRVVVAVVVLVLLARHEGDVSPFESSLFEVFNSLPQSLDALFRGLYTIGALWAVGIVAAAALIARRWRLAGVIALTGFLAWLIGRLLGLLVEDPSLSRAFDLVTRLDGETPTFPFVRLAVVTAVVCAASPFLTRPTRRAGQLVIVALAPAAMYLGIAFPSGVLGGLVLGWGVAALVHFALGSPGGRPTMRQVAGALGQLGVDAQDLHLAPLQTEGTAHFLAHDDRGELAIEVIGRDAADAQLLAKLTRFVLYKDSGPRLSVTRRQQVEHEAFLLLLAAQHDVRVPELVIAGVAGPGAAILVQRRPAGRLLRDVDPATLTDAVLDSLWEQVRRLHDAPLVHGRLDGEHVVLGDDGPVLIRFRTAEVSTEPMARNRDVAALLAATAARVGAERAVAACRRVLGADALAVALPVLQSAVLSRDTRAATGAHRKEVAKSLAHLRAVGAEAAGVEEPQLQQLHRVSGTNLMMAIGTLIAMYVLLGQVGSPEELWNTIQGAKWEWVVLAFVVSMSTNVAFAIALMGTVPIRLPLWPTTETQVAMSFSNLAIPAIGGTAVQIRYLQKQGVDLASAVASGGLLATVANVVGQLLVFVVAVLAMPDSLHLGNIDVDAMGEAILLAVLVAGLVTAIVLGIPKLRHLVVPPVVQAAGTIWTALRSPRKVALLLGGNMLAALLYGLVLLCDIKAFGGDVSFWSTLALNIGVGTIASLVPIPGGNTAVSSVGLSGGLVAFGVPDAVAVAAVLTNQLVVSYLPALPGWWATQDMLHRDYL